MSAGWPFRFMQASSSTREQYMLSFAIGGVAWLGVAWRGVAWRGVEGTWYNIADCSFIFVISFPDSIACYRLNYIDYTVGTAAKLKLQNFLNFSVSAFCFVVSICDRPRNLPTSGTYFHSVMVVVLGSSLLRVSDSDDVLQYTKSKNTDFTH